MSLLLDSLFYSTDLCICFCISIMLFTNYYSFVKLSFTKWGGMTLQLCSFFSRLLLFINYCWLSSPRHPIKLSSENIQFPVGPGHWRIGAVHYHDLIHIFKRLLWKKKCSMRISQLKLRILFLKKQNKTLSWNSCFQIIFQGTLVFSIKPQELRERSRGWHMHVWVKGPTQKGKRLTALTKQLPFYLLSI